MIPTTPTGKDKTVEMAKRLTVVRDWGARTSKLSTEGLRAVNATLSGTVMVGLHHIHLSKPVTQHEELHGGWCVNCGPGGVSIHCQNNTVLVDFR